MKALVDLNDGFLDLNNLDAILVAASSFALSIQEPFDQLVLVALLVLNLSVGKLIDVDFSRLSLSFAMSLSKLFCNVSNIDSIFSLLTIAKCFRMRPDTIIDIFHVQLIHRPSLQSRSNVIVEEVDWIGSYLVWVSNG